LRSCFLLAARTVQPLRDISHRIERRRLVLGAMLPWPLDDAARYVIARRASAYRIRVAIEIVADGLDQIAVAIPHGDDPLLQGCQPLPLASHWSSFGLSMVSGAASRK